MTGLSRRHWLLRALAVTGLAGPASAWSRAPVAADAFDLGVASGAPQPDSVVLWTRLTDPALLERAGQAPLMVRWELAHDEAFASIARSGTSAAAALLGHSVHVEVDGLAPDRWYWYRFMVGDAVSATGRTRTAPPRDALPARLRLGFSSCQRWEHGHFSAWRDLAQSDPDLVVFLGDYVYEYPAPAGPVRSHSLTAPRDLDGYRARYGLYKRDPDLQQMHATCPWLVTWDDHEVQNDYAGEQPEDLAGNFAARRIAAYQAFYEHMPLRRAALVRGLAGLGEARSLRVDTSHGWGQLASFHLMDSRQFRDPQACPKPGRGGQNHVSPEQCPALDDPARSLLGAAQEARLDAAIAGDRTAGTRWSVLAQQTLVTPRNFEPGPGQRWWTDGWDGYPRARQRMIDSLRAHQPRNPVFIGGDIHQNWVCDVTAEPGRPGAPVIASEFCGTSISARSGMTADRVAAMAARADHVHLADGQHRGYCAVEITPSRWTSTLRTVDDMTQRDSGCSTLARFVVEDRRPGVLPG